MRIMLYEKAKSTLLLRLVIIVKINLAFPVSATLQYNYDNIVYCVIYICVQCTFKEKQKRKEKAKKTRVDLLVEFCEFF